MTNWSNTFEQKEQQAQQSWGDPKVWNDARIQRLIWNHVPTFFHDRIEAGPFFFLATSNHKGECDCSFKGGGPNLIRMLSERQLAFPDFDGNHAFMSLGNILDNPYVGLLFIDFSDGARLRVNGRATIHDQGPMLDLFDKSKRVVVIDIEQVMPNCAAHIPKLVPATEHEHEQLS